MHRLHRDPLAPAGLRRYQYGRDTWSMQSPTSAERGEIWAKLDAMQGSRCAYCEAEISEGDRHIEHPPKNSSKSPCRWTISTWPSAREKSIRHGHPSTLHLWWARRPLAAARAVIFAQMVNDPGGERGWGAGKQGAQAAPSASELFKIIEELVQWENTNNEAVLARARAEIRKSWRETCALNKGHPQAAELFNPDKLPAFHDPFAGGGALPLEAQRLGLESYASDLNPVAVTINKAMIEIPPKFAGRAPVGPPSRPSAAPRKARALPSPTGPARAAWPRTCAATAPGCASRRCSASATCTPASKSLLNS
jgi:hypothetical protein